MSTRPVVVHLTTTDISLELLLGPQLRAFRDAGYDVIAMSAPGPFVAALEADGIRQEHADVTERIAELRVEVSAADGEFAGFELRPTQ